MEYFQRPNRITGHEMDTDKTIRLVLWKKEMAGVIRAATMAANRKIKMPVYQYRNSHYKDKNVLRPSYRYNGNPYI